jgi:mRNA-degrading endonuclease RelE of RelBE toxin-antitoxin system
VTTWAISIADTFINELLNLPQNVQKRVSKIVKILESDPISAQGDAKKLKGYTNNVYRTRIGDYRLFYSFGQGWVKLLSIRKRDERTYEIE